jgi:hypothetical protein
MPYFRNYAGALRCIGQALQNQHIEVFEIKTNNNEFCVQCGHPNPPYTALIQLQFSPDDIKILDREGHARGFKFSPFSGHRAKLATLKIPR